MPKIKTESKAQITVRIAASTAARLDALVIASEIPKGVHVQLALNDYLAKQKPPLSPTK